MIGYSRTVVYAAVVDPSDRILAHSNPKLEGRSCRRAESVERLKTLVDTRASSRSLFGQPEVYEAQVPMRLGERPSVPSASSVSTSLLKQELAQAALYSLAVALAALGIAVAVGLVVGHLLLQSLRKIANWDGSAGPRRVRRHGRARRATTSSESSRRGSTSSASECTRSNRTGRATGRGWKGSSTASKTP